MIKFSTVLIYTKVSSIKNCLFGNIVVRIRRITSSNWFSIGLRSSACAGHFRTRWILCFGEPNVLIDPWYHQWNIMDLLHSTENPLLFPYFIVSVTYETCPKSNCTEAFTIGGMLTTLPWCLLSAMRPVRGQYVKNGWCDNTFPKTVNPISSQVRNTRCHPFSR